MPACLDVLSIKLIIMQPVKTSVLSAIALAIIALATYSCKKQDISVRESLHEEVALSSKPDDPGFSDNNMVLYWNAKAAEALNIGYSQPARTRVFARIQVAVHDALNSIKPKYERYAFHEREQHANPDAAVASAAYWIMKRSTFPGVPADTLDKWYNESLATIPNGESKELGKDLGKRSADALIANRANDGHSQVIVTSTTPPNGTNPGEYRSTLTAVNYVPAQTLFGFRNIPNWGTVAKPWVIESNYQFRPVGPYSVTSNEYMADFNEVKSKGARVGSTRNTEEERIGKFWSDNRPSYIWNEIVRKAIANKKLDAWKTARLFALMHVSMAESISSQLNAGYHFYFWRPETAIRLGGTPDWLPALSEVPTFVTAPVPGYPSGYAAYGGATAEILRLFLGTDQTSIDITSTTTNPLVTDPKPSFHFSTFSQAARDNSLSMIYNGWDFRRSALVGEEMGKQIANYVFTHAFREE